MNFEKEIELYFELKGVPESSKESYLRRIHAFMDFIRVEQHKSPEDITVSDIQQYILYLKNGKSLSAGTINNYISGVRLFYSHITGIPFYQIRPLLLSGSISGLIFLPKATNRTIGSFQDKTSMNTSM